MGLDGPIPTARAMYLSEHGGDDESRETRERLFFGSIRQKNGTYKYTYGKRLDDLNDLVFTLLPEARPLRVMDVAVSSGISTQEWSRSLDRRGVEHALTAGDINLSAYIVPVGRHLSVLVDGAGYPLQFDIFGRAVTNPPPRRSLPLYLPFLVLFRAWLRLFFRPSKGAGRPSGCRPVMLVSPRLLGNDRIRMIEDDITQNTSIRGEYHVLRAANILNRDYFDEPTLARILANLRGRLVEGGLLIVCTTTGDIGSDDPAGITNDGSIFRLDESGRFEVVGRIGQGSSVEALVLGLPPSRPARSVDAGSVGGKDAR